MSKKKSFFLVQVVGVLNKRFRRSVWLPTPLEDVPRCFRDYGDMRRGHPRGEWGRRRPPLVALLPRLPPTRRWAVDDRAHDALLHATARGGRGRGDGGRAGGRGGGGGGRDPRGGGTRAPSVWRHVQLPPSYKQTRLPLGRRSGRRPRRGGRWSGRAPGAARPPDGCAAPEPPRPAAGAAIDVAAASTGMPIRAVAAATAASPPRRCSVGGRFASPGCFRERAFSTVFSRYKRIVYKRIWVASLPFQSVWATFSLH